MSRKEKELKKSLAHYKSKLKRELGYSKDLQNEDEITH